MADQSQPGGGPGDNNPIVRAWNAVKADIETEQIRKVIKIENGRPKIDPSEAKKLAKDQNKRAIQGATGGAIVGALISVSGVLTIPLAAAGAAVGYAIDRNKIEQVEELEEDFEKVLEAIENEEEVELSKLAMITQIKKETLAEDYLPYLEEQGFVKFDEDNDMIIFTEPVLHQALSYFRG